MSSKTIEVYGIKNCDTVKKSLKWLEQNDFDIVFHDFKKEAITTELTKQWLNQIDPAILINRRGTTWRKLSDEQKALTEPNDLSALIIENSSLVKRPVVLFNGGWSVGFNAEQWQQNFLTKA